ncbi:MAG: hypothetical protein U1E36_06785 [Rickettsiales bacterium]
MLDSICCYIPVSLIDTGNNNYLEDISQHPRFDTLKSYFMQHLLVGNPVHMTNEAIKDILKVYQALQNSKIDAQQIKAVRRLMGDAIAQYVEIRWLLDNSWHPYYVAPICAEDPLRYLVEYTNREELGLLRPDLITGKCEKTLLLEFLFQVTRYIYIKLNLPKESLSDDMIIQDRVHLKNHADTAKTACESFIASFPAQSFTSESLYTRFENLLDLQTTLDDDPVNLHHDADVIAALHLLRMELDMALGNTPSWSLDIHPSIDALCKHMTPGIWAFYKQKFLPKLAQQTNSQSLWD